MRRCCVYDTLHLYHSASVPFSLDVSDGQKAADVLYNVKVSTQNNPGTDLYLARQRDRIHVLLILFFIFLVTDTTRRSTL